MSLARSPRLLVLVALAGLAGPGDPPAAIASVYYVDAAIGNDAWNGRATADQGGGTGPWKTLSRVNTASLVPGDFVLLRRSQTWRETLAPTRDGTPAQPITFGAYGSGAAPVISGANAVAGWTSAPPNHWASLASQPPDLYQDDARLTRVSSLGQITNGAWWWDAARGRVYMRALGGDSPAGHRIEAPARDSAILGHPDYTSYQDLVADKTTNLGFNSWGIGVKLARVESRYNRSTGFMVRGSRMVLDDCESHHNQGHGIHSDEAEECVFIDIDCHHNSRSGFLLSHSLNTAITRGSSSYNGTATFEGNGIDFTACNGAILTGFNSHHNSGNGLDAILGSASIVIEGGEFHDSGGGPYLASGVRFDTNSTGCILRHARSYSNQSAGVVIEDHASGITIAYNLFYDNTAGMTATNEPGSGNTYYNNVCYGNREEGMAVYNWREPNPGFTAKNNILAANKYGMRFNSLGAAGAHVIDYNLYYGNSHGAVERDGALYSQAQIANGTYYNQTGYERRGLGADPRFAGPAAADFRLLAGSPAIDRGTDVGLRVDHAGEDVPQGAAVDIGAFEFAAAPAAVDEQLDALGAGDAPLVRGPNPWRATLWLAGPQREPVEVLDAAGRAVARIAPGALAWDGRGAGGRPAPAGVYFLRGLASGRLARVVRVP
jgi:hypothetical protein